MSVRPPEKNKDIAIRLAAMIAGKSQDEAVINELQLQLGMHQQVSATNGKAHNTSNIGIWSPRLTSEGTIYLRDTQYRREWSFWADVDRIPVRSDKKRVLFLGESVARGYFYDPVYTPAKALQAILDNDDLIPVEVLDLARTSMEMNDLQHLCLKVMDLDPDLLVCYAGNNWLWHLFASLDEADFGEISAILLSGQGYPALKAALEKRMSALVTSFVATLNEINIVYKVPVIFIIPAFNLLDWKSSDLEKVTPWLGDDNTTAWKTAKQLAEAALSEGDILLAENYIREMQLLDGEKHPGTFELLAACRQQEGRLEEARTLLESARDTALYGRVDSKPRILSAIRETLLEQLTIQGITFIDVQQLLETQCDTLLPGRQQFLDYCHHNAATIKLVMQYAAQAIIRKFTGVTLSVGSLDSAEAMPSAAVDAYAHIFAAVHNAHYGQHYPNLYYYCNRALELAPQAADMMKWYTDMATYNANNMLCHSHELLVESGASSQYEGGIGILHERYHKLLDLELVDAMLDVLEGTGVQHRQEIEALRIAQHTASEIPLNLLTACYHRSSYESVYGTATAYFRSRDSHTTFYLVASAGNNLQISITFRLPPADYKESVVEMKFNGRKIKEVRGTAEWHTEGYCIPAELVIEGVNIITIEWPVAVQIHMDTDKMFDYNPVGALLDIMYPVYGEIHDCTAFVEAK